MEEISKNHETAQLGIGDVMLRSFINYLKDNNFELKTDNPRYRPGEGYGPPRYISWTIDRVVSDFLKENEA